MSLLEEIQISASDSSVSIEDLLRKCKILASKLDHSDFKNWVDSELNGYKSIEELPSYRILKVQSKGHFGGPFGSGLRNAPIPLGSIKEEYRDLVRYQYISEGISAFSQLLTNPDAGTFQSPWSHDLVAAVSQQIYDGYSCLQAWKEIPRGTITYILDVLRTKILDFSLEIEKIYPDVGDIKGFKVSKEAVDNVFNNYIMGGNNNLSQASQHVSQNITISQSNFDELAAFLKNVGFPDTSISELKAAIALDEASQNKSSFGEKVTGWLGQAALLIGTNAVSISKEVSIQMIIAALQQYYGF